MLGKRPLNLIKDARREPPVGSHLLKIVACEEKLEEALHFLVRALDDKPKRGKKPVVMHSLRVSYMLVAMGYGTDVVVAGLLHDVLEKTGLTQGQLSRRFGIETALIVAANTNSARIHDPLDRYRDSLERCAAYGEGALLVRAADLIDNCDRLAALGSSARLDRVAEKMKMLVRFCRDEVVDERMIEELGKRLRRIARKSGGLKLVAKRTMTRAVGR